MARRSTRPMGSNPNRRRWAPALAVTAGLGSLVAAFATVGSDAAARKIETMPVSQLKPGMKGHAMTVFSGQTPERFEIEIVDTIPNYLPRQDAILFRAIDPRLAHSGIVGGMSGSPIYIGDKMVGALAYGWRFNKDPLGALTPIDNMIEVGNLPHRREVRRQPSGRTRAGASGWADAMLGLDTSPLPPRRRPDELDPSSGLVQLQVPLSVAGLGASSSRMLAETFGMVPVRGGSGGAMPPPDQTPKRKWQPGDAVSVVLVRGDSSVAGNGTVTWVSPKGDRLLAFGHSMFNDGPTDVPMADARVHTIIASVERSVKISSPQTIQGLMYQDRQPAIALRTDTTAPMIPVHTEIQGPDPDLAPRTYANHVAFGLDLTPNLLAVVLAEGVDEAARDSVEVVLQVRHEISLETSRGTRDVVIDEEVFFPGGLIGRMLGRSRGILTASAMLDNDFEVGRILGVRQRVRMEYGAPVESIERVRLAQEEVRAGDVVRLEVELRSYKGETRLERLPLRIPDDAGGQQVQIQVAGGNFVRPYRPIPGSLDDLVTTLSSSYPARAMVASVYREGEGLSTRHGLIHQLPDSVLETLVDRGSTVDSVTFKQLARRVIPTKTLIDGEHNIRVDVLPAKTL
jgi:hypothetical protein